MMKRLSQIALQAILLVVVTSLSAQAASTDELVATIKGVDREGNGHVAARKALQQLMQSDADQLPTILRGFQQANPLSENWLRGAVESIADRSLKQNAPLPKKKLEAFILDREQNPRARRLAFEWLVKVDETADDRLIPTMIDDPSHELRREAVAKLIEEARTAHNMNKKEAATETYLRALSGAIDDDQVRLIVNPLRKLGQHVDLQRHFGFLTQWQMIGPFDNREGVGFAATYVPEAEIDLKKSIKGQLGDVTWAPIATEHDYGLIDIAKQIGPYKGAVMYGMTEFHSPRQQKVELRMGTPNAWIIWVNGEKVFGREEYHRGMAMDQFRVEATMQPGKNRILLKLCQDEKTQSWAQRYQFQFRVCDQAGAAILSHAGERSASLEKRKTSE